MSALDVDTAARESAARELARELSIADFSITDFFDARAPDVDAGRATVREGLAFLGQQGFASANIVGSIGFVAAVARSDMASAFSAWAHRMVIDYISVSTARSGARAYLSELVSAERLGATALAAGTAHVLAGVPLPLTFRDDGDDLVLEGRIPWASNLIVPFLVVTAAVAADDPARSIVVALPSEAPGLHAAPYPQLLALGATGSTTLELRQVRVSRDLIIADDVFAFTRAVLARFLLLQGAFCSGLASRSLEEAERNLGPMGEALRPQLDRAVADRASADARTSKLAHDAIAELDAATDDLLELRLRWSELATSAVGLELAATGGRGYLAGSPTARRVREAAFLPIQAPTEVLLRWLLSRSG